MKESSLNGSHSTSTIEYLTGEGRSFPKELAQAMRDRGVKFLHDGAHVRQVLNLGNRDLIPTGGLLIPYQLPDGSPVIDQKTGREFVRLRCVPEITKNGKKTKYLSEKSSANHLYFPDGVLDVARDRAHLVITEGELKAELATYHGFPTVALAGVDAWKFSEGWEKEQQPDGTTERVKKESVPIVEFELIPWGELERVYIVYDSDVKTKIPVRGARRDLGEWIHSTYGVEVWYINLPHEAEGEKNGLDDYITRHGADAFAKRIKTAKRAYPKPQAKEAFEGEAPDIEEMVNAVDRHLTGVELREAFTPIWDAIYKLSPDKHKPYQEDIASKFPELNMGESKNGLRGARDRAKAYEDELKAAEEAWLVAEANRKRQEKLQDALDTYGLDLSGFGCKYIISDEGVQLTTDRGLKDIIRLPIYPTRTGDDLVTGRPWVEVAWQDERRITHKKWVPHDSLKSAEVLIGEFDRSLIDAERVRSVSRWLIEAPIYLSDDKKGQRVVSRIGWVGEGEKQRFILTGDAETNFAGVSLESRGSLEEWAKGVHLLASFGDRAYKALACLGLSAASPLVRLIGKRNPIIGMTGRTSTGKTTAIAYALSIWARPDSMTAAVGSTDKGVQDKSTALCDLPFFFDELHRLLGERDGRNLVERFLYFCGNGQRRSTSNKRQEAVGGESRFGAHFYAAEYPVLNRLHGGVQNRVIELEGSDTMPDSETSETLKSIYHANYGLLAIPLGEIVNRDGAKLGEQIKEAAALIKKRYPDLQGDDHYAIALIIAGLGLLEDALGQGDIFTQEMTGKFTHWLAGTLSANRGSLEDAATAAFEDLIGFLRGSDGWYDPDENQDDERSGADYNPKRSRKDDDIKHLRRGDDYMAWELDDGSLEINPSAKVLQEVARRHQGGLESHATTWAERGWIQRQGTHLKVKTKRFGLSRVWRVPAKFANGSKE